MTIGDFSRATRLSAKTLRFYHQVGVLKPASIDPFNGYRLYDTDQIVDAQVVRQLRSLAVPVDTIREILAASEVSTRNELISAHLERLEFQLNATRAAVVSLRGLLGATPAYPNIEHRSVPVTPALVIRQTIDLADLGKWYTDALKDLDASARMAGRHAVGPRGGIWDTNLFLEERGEAVLFYPVDSLEGIRTPAGRIHVELLPAVDLAVAVHRGPDETMAQTYGALGSYVAEHELGVDGPIRETYLQEPTHGSLDVVTEIGWPIFRAGR
jgi:DNA-binding transcriptional MerR regulator